MFRRKRLNVRNSKDKGKESEDFACDYLKSKNYRIIERNFRTRRGEIDIIAEKDGVLIFVEVRSLRKGLFNPIESIGRRKLERIIKAAKYYLMKRRNAVCRFDVIGIIGDGEERSIEHIENAFGYIDLS